jgi:hypothetical protein
MPDEKLRLQVFAALRSGGIEPDQAYIRFARPRWIKTKALSLFPPTLEVLPLQVYPLSHDASYQELRLVALVGCRPVRLVREDEITAAPNTADPKTRIINRSAEED